MKLEITGKPIAEAEVNVDILRKNLQDGAYSALKKAFKVIENELYETEEDFFECVYSEVRWGTFFKLMEAHPKKKKMKLVIFPVRYEGKPVVRKQIVDALKGKFEFTVDKIDGDDYMIVGSHMMTDIDAWLDFFLMARFYDPISKDWEKKIIDLNGIEDGGMEEK